ncbi:MAG: nuclear transport factor 2 family protein [Chloroflexota bacterium]
MTAEQMSAADVYRAYISAERSRDTAAMTALLTPGITIELNGRPVLESAAEDAAAATVLFDAYPDYRREIIELIEQGTVAAARWRMVGHPHEGLRDRFGDLDIAGCSIVEVNDGRITRVHVWSTSGALEEVLALLDE